MTRVSWAVVLAAGGSTRMGFPKALLPVEGRTLVELHCAALSHAVRRVVVAIGAYASEVRAAVPPWVTVVENGAWATTWPADTLRVALRDAHIFGRCFVTPVDVPPARPETLDALLAAAAPAVPLDARGRRGHPVLLDARRVSHIRRFGASHGLASLLEDATLVPTSSPDLALDFDDTASFHDWHGGRPWGEPPR